mgnify:CR=1 FL=1
MDSWSVLEVFRQCIPILLPGPDDDRILFTPFLFQLKKFIFCQFFIYSQINAFQILQEFLLIFGAYIFDVQHKAVQMYWDKHFGLLRENLLSRLYKL